ncbi:MAG: hypothetical protein H6Q68_2780 [Firmicutes bacterium]|nr:hypothetical protein [Bacillota bacterium]
MFILHNQKVYHFLDSKQGQLRLGASQVYFVFSGESIKRCDIRHWGQSRPPLASPHSLQYTVKHRTHLYKGVSMSSFVHRGHVLLFKVHLLSYEHFSAISK